MLGTVVNVAAIIAGALAGSYVLPRLPEKMRGTVTAGVALAVLLIGLDMALGTANVLITILSLAGGAIIGELLHIQGGLDLLGDRLQEMVKGGGIERFGEGFVTATLVYCVGPMAVMGAVQSGLQGDHSTLFAKSMLDGITAVVFSSTLGIGVVGAAVPVFLYQGSIALMAQGISSVLTEAMVVELTAAGGLVIVGIGLNMLKVTKLRVANLMPAIFVAPLVVCLLPYLEVLFRTSLF